jgi:hypothetical protein
VSGIATSLARRSPYSEAYHSAAFAGAFDLRSFSTSAAPTNRGTLSRPSGYATGCPSSHTVSPYRRTGRHSAPAPSAAASRFVMKCAPVS